MNCIIFPSPTLAEGGFELCASTAVATPPPTYSSGYAAEATSSTGLWIALLVGCLAIYLTRRMRRK
jgi:hypothetical protein